MITLADGRDTSWIYDADFRKLSKQQIEAIIVTGTRAEELQLRLKLAEVEVPIIVERDIYKATAKRLWIIKVSQLQYQTIHH